MLNKLLIEVHLAIYDLKFVPKDSIDNTICCIGPHRLVSMSHMRAPPAACREPAGKLWQLCKVLYVFEYKTLYILIHPPFPRIVVFWHIGNVPPMIS